MAFLRKKKKEAPPLQLVISDPYTGIAFKHEIADEKIKQIFWGKRLGEKIEGDMFGFPNYVFEIAGASDDAGFPHVPFVEGPGFHRIILSGPPGYRPRKYYVQKKDGGWRTINLKNVRKKKGVRGNELSERTRQVNLVIVERKGKPLKDLPDDAIIADKVGKEIVTKLGKTILKWGLEKLQIKSGDATQKMGEVLGLSDDILNALYEKVGILFLKNADKQIIFDLRSRGKKHAPPLARHIAATIYELHQKLQKGELKPDQKDQIIQFVVDSLKEGLEKVKAGRIKELKRVPFTIKIEAQAQ